MENQTSYCTNYDKLFAVLGVVSFAAIFLFVSEEGALFWALYALGIIFALFAVGYFISDSKQRAGYALVASALLTAPFTFMVFLLSNATTVIVFGLIPAAPLLAALSIRYDGRPTLTLSLIALGIMAGTVLGAYIYLL